jgi:hypothetical protein
LFKQMKSSFLRKVAVLSAGAVVLSSVSLMGVNAAETNQTDQTTLSGTCNGLTQIQKTHAVDFGSFTTNDVLGGTYTVSGIKSGGNGTSLSESPAWVVTSNFISVLDQCGDNNWTLSMQLWNLTSVAGHTVDANNIAWSGTTAGNYFILSGLNLANTEILYSGATASHVGEEIYAPAAATLPAPQALLARVIGNGDPAPNYYGGEYGVYMTFALRLPQFQPFGVYTGTIVVSLLQ